MDHQPIEQPPALGLTPEQEEEINRQMRELRAKRQTERQQFARVDDNDNPPAGMD